MPRDIARYEDEYAALPFEAEQAYLRRLELLAVLKEVRPRRVLEVGCGGLPLFTDYRSFEEMVVVEPGARFAERAERRAAEHAKRDQIRIEHRFLEDVDLSQDGFATDFDMVIVSALLHEVPDPEAFVRKARQAGGEQASVLVTVPNEASFHRQLAVRLGLIEAPGELSTQQRLLQQDRIFDAASLDELLRRCGLRPTLSRSMIFKPFTHAQMQSILDHGILSREQIHGLCSMMDFVDSGAGSELLVIAEPG